jgi:hypothetical protein
MGQYLLVAGLVIAGIGLLVMAGVPFGRLPGDLTFRRGAVTFHVPIVTCLVLSVLLTIVLSLFRR